MPASKLARGMRQAFRIQSCFRNVEGFVEIEVYRHVLRKTNRTCFEIERIGRYRAANVHLYNNYSIK